MFVRRLAAELANGRLAMMAIIGSSVSTGGMGFSAFKGFRDLRLRV